MGNSNVDYFHPEGSSKKDFIQEIESHLEGSKEFDYPAVLTSFDRHVEDRGRQLETMDDESMSGITSMKIWN
jgi:hypothetical protein